MPVKWRSKTGINNRQQASPMFFVRLISASRAPILFFSISTFSPILFLLLPTCKSHRFVYLSSSIWDVTLPGCLEEEALWLNRPEFVSRSEADSLDLIPFPLLGRIMLTWGKGCPSIFIGLLLESSSSILPWSMTCCISFRKTMQSLVSWVLELCHLQYFHFLSSAADGMTWLLDNFNCPACSSRSKILSAFAISKLKFSGSFFPKGNEIAFLVQTHSAKPISGSLSSSVSTSIPTLATFLGNDRFFDSNVLVSTLASLCIMWLKLSNSYAEYFSLMCGKSPSKAMAANSRSSSFNLKHRLLTSLNRWRWSGTDSWVFCWTFIRSVILVQRRSTCEIVFLDRSIAVLNLQAMMRTMQRPIQIMTEGTIEFSTHPLSLLHHIGPGIDWCAQL